jgi:hypothetical protein
VTYTSRNFKPSISFKTPPGHWRAAVADHADHVELEPDTVPPLAAAGIAFHHATQVFPPDKGGKIAGDAVAGPENFATWLTSHPHLKTTQPKPVAALGLEGVSIDVRAKSSSPRKYKDCGKFSGACVVLMMGGVEPILYAGEILGRFLVLEQPDGKQLVVEEWFEPASAAEVGFKLLDQAVANARFVGG